MTRGVIHRAIAALLVCVALTVSGAVVAAHQLLDARDSLVRGSHDLESARSLVLAGHGFERAAQRSELRVELARARSELGRARADLASWAPVLAHLSWLPSFGGELAAISPAANTAYLTTRSVEDLLNGAEPALDAWTQERAGNRLRSLAKMLAVRHSSFRHALVDANAAAASIALLSRPSGNPALDAGVHRLRTMIPLLRAAATWLAVAPALLGEGRRSRVLLVLQNPAELRATGGFIGALEYVQLHNGSAQAVFSDSALPREVGGIATPLPEALYTPEGQWLLRDSNWSPDFPLTARLERWFYGEDTNRWVDGVVDIVDTVAPSLIAATGPVYVPDYHVRITAGNVFALSQRYVHGPAAPSGKAFLGALLRSIARRLASLPTARLLAVAHVLADAVSRHDILLYDTNPAVESAISSVSADGALRPTGGDFLAVVDDNRSYNKLNPYVRETASLQVRIAPDRSEEAVLSLHYAVAASPADLEGMGPGAGMWGSKHDYQDFLRVYVPPGARLLAERGLDRWAPVQAYSLTQFAGRLLVRAGRQATAEFRYVLPPDAWSSLHPAVYRLTVRRQPGADLQAISVTIAGSDGVRVGVFGAGMPLRAVLQLGHDASLVVPLHGARLAGQSVFSDTSRQPDPYLPYSDFRDPRHPL
ncbi:MAG TPA: DUF4012 domain-containing protein [Chloroflexota bacterium]|nr:DUF4012 domain-containing protein [Chloroflexota bacterium]